MVLQTVARKAVLKDYQKAVCWAGMLGYCLVEKKVLQLVDSLAAKKE